MCQIMIVGGHTIQEIMARIDRFAPTDATVLVHGETGTGKELLAHFIHHRSLRHDGPFVVADLSTLSPHLLENELFGHERGAFTDAREATNGLFQEAEGGTLFLDEIAEVPYAVQAKLLRAVELKEIRPVGSTKNMRIGTRLIAATSRRLETLVREHKFREDLFYRLKIISLYIPSLRERPEDIPLLVAHFLKTWCSDKHFTDEAMAKLVHYPWPGNVRELKQLVEYCVIMGRDNGAYGLDLLPAKFKENGHSPAGSDGSLKSRLRSYERQEICNALTSFLWNVTSTAQALGITPQALRKKLRAYGIERRKAPRSRMAAPPRG